MKVENFPLTHFDGLYDNDILNQFLHTRQEKKSLISQLLNSVLFLLVTLQICRFLSVSVTI